MNQEYKSFSSKEKGNQDINSVPLKIKNNKKFFLILIFIIILILIIVGFVLFNLGFRIDDQSNKDSQIEIEYLSYLNPNQLGEINKEENQIFLKNRKEYCQNIDNENMKNDCLEKIKIDQVLILEDDGLCDNIGEQKNICFSHLAKNKDDLNICEKISDQKIKDDCKDEIYFSRIRKKQEENIQLNIEWCEKIKKESMQEMCLEEFLMLAEDFSVCDLDFVRLNEWQDKCQNIVLLNQAVKQKDISMCQQISLVYYKDNCIKIIERIEK